MLTGACVGQQVRATVSELPTARWRQGVDERESEQESERVRESVPGDQESEEAQGRTWSRLRVADHEEPALWSAPVITRCPCRS